MNIRNAWGFLSFGLVMGLLPWLAPTWFPPTGIDGSSARALWLELMGGVQTLLGGVCVLWQCAVPASVRWLAFVPPSPAVMVFEPDTEEVRAAVAFEENEMAEAA